MSSEISTESQRALSATPIRHSALEPWQLFTLAGLIAATVVVFLSVGQTPAGVILLSLIIFTAAVVGAAVLRTLGPLVGRDQPAVPHVPAGRTRAALEREKTLLLRAIKDLEFDRAMGKVSPRDFQEMNARLRTRAAGLIRQLDAGARYRTQIEEEIANRLRAAPTEPGEAHDPAAARRCVACGTPNEGDARYCKQCGSALSVTR
jgi:hypothetical protein